MSGNILAGILRYELYVFRVTIFGQKMFEDFQKFQKFVGLRAEKKLASVSKLHCTCPGFHLEQKKVFRIFEHIGENRFFENLLNLQFFPGFKWRSLGSWATIF